MPDKLQSPPLDIDIVVEAGQWPAATELSGWVERAASAVFTEIGAGRPGHSELGVTFTNDAHISVLNADWRGKPKPTNVLSFPAFPETKEGPLPPMLGDIVLAAETVAAESKLENKLLEHHITHLVVHGLLHLLGHDHITDEQAEEMEAIERAALARLAIPDPYA